MENQDQRFSNHSVSTVVGSLRCLKEVHFFLTYAEISSNGRKLKLHGFFIWLKATIQCRNLLCVMMVFTVALLNLKVFQRGGRNQHKHVYSFFLVPYC